MSRIIRKRIFADYLVQLAIVENPWKKEPRKLVEVLQRETKTEELGKAKLDRRGMARLKRMLSKSKQIGVK